MMSVLSLVNLRQALKEDCYGGQEAKCYACIAIDVGICQTITVPCLAIINFLLSSFIYLFPYIKGL